jgi:hypothetical protein
LKNQTTTSFFEIKAKINSMPNARIAIQKVAEYSGKNITIGKVVNIELGH